MGNQRAEIDQLRAAQEYKSYVPPEPGDEEEIAAARADEIEKFNVLDAALGRELDKDFPEENDLAPPKTSTPEQIYAEGKLAAQAARERAAAKVRADGGKPRDERGKFQKQAMNTLSSSLGLDDEAPEGGESSEREAPTDVGGALENETLRTKELELALIRSGFDENQIADMKRLGTFESKGLKRQLALKADDEAHAYVREQRKAAESGGKSESREPGRKPEPTEQLDIDPLVKPLAAKLGLDEDGASTLKQSFEQLASKLTQHAEKQIERGLGRVSEAQAAQAGQQVFADAQVEFGVRCPDLLDPKKFDEALEVASELAKTQVVQRQLQRFATPREKAVHLLSAAAHALELEIKPSGSESDARGERQLRAHARSTVSDRTRPAPSTAREKDMEAFNDSMARHGF